MILRRKTKEKKKNRSAQRNAESPQAGGLPGETEEKKG